MITIIGFIAVAIIFYFIGFGLMLKAVCQTYGLHKDTVAADIKEEMRRQRGRS